MEVNFTENSFYIFYIELISNVATKISVTCLLGGATSSLREVL